MELHWQQKQTRQGQWLGKVKWEGGGGGEASETSRGNEREGGGKGTVW